LRRAFYALPVVERAATRSRWLRRAFYARLETTTATACYAAPGTVAGFRDGAGAPPQPPVALAPPQPSKARWLRRAFYARLETTTGTA
jgi:hypothetical protein